MDPKEKQRRKERRHQRSRVNTQGTKMRPRVSVFRSNQHTYAQLINDQEGDTLVNTSDQNLDQESSEKTKQEFEEKFRDPEQARKTFQAYRVGKLIAQKAQKKDIDRAVFDRSGYKYHGRIKALAEGIRDGGVQL